MDAENTSNKETLRRSEERFKLLVESVRDYAIFMLDPEGRVLTWNAGAQRFKGYSAEEIIGQHFSRFYPAEALARDLPGHELKVAAATGVFEDEGWRVRKDGSLFWANVVITAMRDASGELVGFAKVTRDLTQRRDHEEDLRRSEERLRLLIEGVREYAIFMLDANGSVVTWNVGAQRIKGYRAEEIIGQHFSVFYPQDCAGQRLARARAAAGRRDGQLRRYGMAAAQGRHGVLGQRHDHRASRRCRPAPGLRQADPRPDGEQARRGHGAGQPAARGNAGRRAQRAHERRSARPGSRTNSWRRCRTNCARR